jgi:hypothetical protein
VGVSKNNWNASATPSGIKSQWYVCMYFTLYDQHHVTLYSCSLILALMPLKQNRYKVQSVLPDVLLTVHCPYQHRTEIIHTNTDLSQHKIFISILVTSSFISYFSLIIPYPYITLNLHSTLKFWYIEAYRPLFANGYSGDSMRV